MVVVNDGSDDRTGEVADELAARYPGRVHVVHHEVNKGYGAAVRTGITTALDRTDVPWVFLTDSDGQFKSDELPQFVAEARAERADAVIGFRMSRADPIMRKVNAWLWTRASRLLPGRGRQGRGLRLQARWQAGARRRPVARRRGAHLTGTADEDPGQGRADPAAAGPALPPPARRADRGEAVGHPRLAHRADPAVGEADKRRAARPRTPRYPASARRGLHGADRRGRSGLGHLLSHLRRSAPVARLPGNGPRPAYRARHRRGGRLGPVGTVWLPFWHLLVAATAWNDTWYYSGFSGSALSMVAYVLATRYLYRTAVALTGSRMAA